MHRTDILNRVSELSIEGLESQEEEYYWKAEREADNPKVRHRYCFKVWYRIHEELEKRRKGLCMTEPSQE